MDGSTVEHSDSDSGESWTLLENHPAYGDDAPDFAETINPPSPFERNQAHQEKDEDTDGISVISDSDPELVPCDANCDQCSAENCPSQVQDIPYILNDPQPPNDKKTIESLCNEDDFLEDGTVKLKTYVHRRNKRLSMVLNVIMLGSVITAAGVAIGHMWGAKNECAVPIPSVNKILSNLYKLQEENAYLRNQLKELRLAGNIQQLKKPDREKVTMTQRRYKKVFEEPLNVDNSGKTLKCANHDSNKNKKPDDNGQIPIHEQEFLSDIGKLKKVYNQNRSWLDEHIQRRLMNENNIRNKRNTKLNESIKVFSMKQFGPAPKLYKVEENDESAHDLKKQEFHILHENTHNVWNLPRQAELAKNEKNKNSKPDLKISGTEKSHKVVNLERQLTSEDLGDLIEVSTNSENFNRNKREMISSNLNKEKKISYADSLKSETDSEKIKNLNNNSHEEPNLPIRGMRGYGHKRKLGDDGILLNSQIAQSLSEAEIQKDDRYTGVKIKGDKRKHDRHKIHKKQKRKNKYQQWEMKGGYMKDFDEFSMTSPQVNLGNDFIMNPEKKYHNNDFELYLNKLTDSDQKKPKKGDDMKLEKKCEKGKKVDWFDKRHTLRAEARKKLEQELFGETSPNNAAWYFKRMNKREQCRTQKDNSTFRKFTKQKMNFKMKH